MYMLRNFFYVCWTEMLRCNIWYYKIFSWLLCFYDKIILLYFLLCLNPLSAKSYNALPGSVTHTHLWVFFSTFILRNCFPSVGNELGNILSLHEEWSWSAYSVPLITKHVILLKVVQHILTVELLAWALLSHMQQRNEWSVKTIHCNCDSSVSLLYAI